MKEDSIECFNERRFKIQMLNPRKKVMKMKNIHKEADSTSTLQANN